MFNNKNFSSFLKLCSVLPALAIMPAVGETIDLNESYTRGEFTNIVYNNGNSYSLTTDTIFLSSDDNFGVRAGNGTSIVLGDDSTTLISVLGAPNPGVLKPAMMAREKGQINVETNSLVVTGGYGIWVQNSTSDPAIPDAERATVNINADNISITATQSALVAMSEGIINMEGNVNISGVSLLETRGGAKTYINKTGNSENVILSGNIDFTYDSQTSGTPIDATVDITLNGKNSRWTGNTMLDYGTTTPPAGYLEVTGGTLTLKNGATWNATNIPTVAEQGFGSYYVKLNNLNLHDGTVNVQDTTNGIIVDKIVATDATFTGGPVTVNGTMNVSGLLTLDSVIKGDGDVKFENGSSLLANMNGETIIAGNKVTGTTTLVLDKESVGKSFKINGTTENSLKFTDNVLFDITSAGDELKTWTISRKSVAEQTAGLEKAGLDSNAAKTVAAMSAVKTTGNVAADALFAGLTAAAQSGDAEAAETINEVAKVINPESEAVVQSAAVSTQNIINDLAVERMDMGRNGGDLSLSSGGVWVQGLFNRAKSGDKFSANTRGISAGIDGTISNDIMLGIGYAYGHSDVSAKTRDTDIDNHSVFLYGQYRPTQWYANATLNYTTSGYKENGSVMGLAVDSEYRANAFGANVATGYELPFGLIPELGLRYLHVRTNDYTNSLGFHTDAKNTNFLTGIIGARYGFDIASSGAWLIRPELSAAAKYDLVSDGNTATVALPGVDAYTLDVERLNRFGGEFGAGLTMSYYGFDLSLTYYIDVREDYTSQTGMAKFRYNF